MVNFMTYGKSLKSVVSEEEGIGFNKFHTRGAILKTDVEGIPISRADIQELHAFEVQSEFLENGLKLKPFLGGLILVEEELVGADASHITVELVHPCHRIQCSAVTNRILLLSEASVERTHQLQRGARTVCSSF